MIVLLLSESDPLRRRAQLRGPHDSLYSIIDVHVRSMVVLKENVNSMNEGEKSYFRHVEASACSVV